MADTALQSHQGHSRLTGVRAEGERLNSMPWGTRAAARPGFKAKQSGARACFRHMYCVLNPQLTVDC